MNGRGFIKSWGWRDESDNTALHTQYSPWRSEVEHATSRPPKYWIFTSGRWGNILFLETGIPERLTTISSHLKLCLATAIHSLKWLKIRELLRAEH